jgi:Sulfotransferase family
VDVACLYEHPQICMPQKETNFFSRDRNWTRGFDWYEGIFSECAPSEIAGEFSTSYLTTVEAPGRIRDRYPGVRLIVSLRHSVDRAYSSYLNDIVAGVVPAATNFGDALQAHPEYVEAGKYARHLSRYLQLFARDQLLVSFFDDARRDRLAAMRQIYEFLGADPVLCPTMLDRRVGLGRVRRFQWMERALIDASGAFRTRGALRPLWWTAKRLGVGDRLRALNTRNRAADANGLRAEEREALIRELEPALDVLEHTNTIHYVFDELCRVARRHIVIALPNQFDIGNRWATVLGRNRSGKYGLPLEPPSDRHRWLFPFEEARNFCRHRAHAVGWRVVDEAVMLGPKRRRIEPLVRIWPSLFAPDLVTHLVPRGQASPSTAGRDR